MLTTLTSLLPIFLMILTGWGLRASGLIKAESWDGFEKVTYLVLFPAMIAYTMAHADLGEAPIFEIGGALVLAILSVSALLIACRSWLAHRLGLSGPSFTSVFQGSIRWNSFVALAISTELHGRTGATLCAIAIAAMIPLVNILSVGVLTRYASADRVQTKPFILSLLRNPFILASILGVCLNPVSHWIPAPVANAASLLGQASLAAGLLAVGAGLQLKSVSMPGTEARFGLLVLPVLLKLCIMPLLAVGFARLFGVSGVELSVVAVCTAVPTASASYILARQFGGDSPLMARILTAQTIIGMLTLPVSLFFISS
ncbi:MAG: AEC family transporter [Hyphomicrobiales bacterium]